MKNEKHRVDGMLIGEYVQKSIKRLFEEKLFELIGQSYRIVPSKTLASEVVNHLFVGLLNNDINPELLSVYQELKDYELLS